MFDGKESVGGGGTSKVDKNAIKMTEINDWWKNQVGEIPASDYVKSFLTFGNSSNKTQYKLQLQLGLQTDS